MKTTSDLHVSNIQICSLGKNETSLKKKKAKKQLPTDRCYSIFSFYISKWTKPKDDFHRLFFLENF